MKKFFTIVLLTCLSLSSFCQSNTIGRSRAEVIQLLNENEIPYQTAKDGHIAYRLGEVYLYNYFNKSNKCILSKSISGVQGEENKQWIIRNFCDGGKKEITKQGTVCYQDGYKYTITFKKSEVFRGWAFIIKEELI